MQPVRVIRNIDIAAAARNIIIRCTGCDTWYTNGITINQKQYTWYSQKCFNKNDNLLSCSLSVGVRATNPFTDIPATSVFTAEDEAEMDGHITNNRQWWCAISKLVTVAEDDVVSLSPPLYLSSSPSSSSMTCISIFNTDSSVDVGACTVWHIPHRYGLHAFLLMYVHASHVHSISWYLVEADVDVVVDVWLMTCCNVSWLLFFLSLRLNGDADVCERFLFLWADEVIVMMITAMFLVLLRCDVMKVQLMWLWFTVCFQFIQCHPPLLITKVNVFICFVPASMTEV